MKFNLFFILLFIAVFYSCDNADLFENQNQPQDSGMKEFAYQGKFYSSHYTILKDSVIWEDEKTGEIYQNLLNNPNLATVVDENGKIAFYDNYDDYLSKISKDSSKNQLRSSTSGIGDYVRTETTWGDDPVTLTLYENINRGGLKYITNVRKIDYYTNGSIFYLSHEFSDFCNFWPRPFFPYASYNINDIISSFELVPTSSTSVQYLEITLFEDVNYGGKSITFSRTTNGSIYINDLTQYIMVQPGLFNHSKTWNDQVSSLKYRFQ